MSSIGPELPPHLQSHSKTGNSSDDDDEGPGPSTSVGPQIPAHLLAGPTKPPPENNDPEGEESDDDDYGPALPPELLAARSGQPAKKVVGPSFPPPPSQGQGHDYGAQDDSDDDDFGPQPLPSGATVEEKDGVREFMEREERRRQQIEEAAKPKTLKRDEWMLVPPSSSDLLGNIDPTKLKARQFARSAAPAKNVDNSLWTETPAERQQRIADEVSGKKRRAANAPEEEPDPDAIKRARTDEEIRRSIAEHTRKTRSETLLDIHKTGLKEKDTEGEKFEGIWDRDRDMALAGRLMDEKSRNKVLADAKGLGDRFGTGKSGGFL